MFKVLRLLLFVILFSPVAFAGVDFDGTDDYVDLGSMGSFGSDLDSQTTSIAFWFKTTDTARVSVFGTGNNTGNDTVLFLQFNTDPTDQSSSQGKTWQRLRDETAVMRQGGADFDTGYTDGEWHHWVSIFHTNADGEIFLDGVSQTWTTSSFGDGSVGTTANFTGSFDISGMNWKGTHCQDGCFGGQISEFYIFDDELTDAEISLLANSKVKGIGRQFDNMRNYLPLDDIADGESADGDMFKDHGTGGDDGTGVDGANNTGLTATAEEVLTYA